MDLNNVFMGWHQGVKILVLFFGMTYLPSNTWAQSSYEQFVKEFSKHYTDGNIENLKPMLSKDFQVGIYTRTYEDFLLNLLTKNFACDSIVFQKALNQTKVKIIFYKQDKSIREGVFTFDTQGLLLYVDVFDALYHVNRDQPSTLVKTIPFEEENGSVFLLCRINDNDRELRLLFDTGADGMALSTTLGEELGLQISRTNKASVVGGNMLINVSDGNTVHIGDFVFPNQGIALFDNFHKGSDGIIGNTLLKKYIVKVDYDKHLLYLYSMGKHDFGKNGITLPVELSGNIHLPISLTMNGGKKYNGRVFFDTGASYNLILFRPFVVKNRILVDGFEPLYAGSTLSMGMSSPTYTGMAESLYIGSQLHTDGFLVSLMAGSGQAAEWKPDADGSLGVGIIGKYNFTVDLMSQSIHFEPNKRYNNPQDFKMADYVFQYDLDGKLLVSRIMSEGMSTRVTAINGIDVEKWLKENNLRAQLEKELLRDDVHVQIENEGATDTLILSKED